VSAESVTLLPTGPVTPASVPIMVYKSPAKKGDTWDSPPPKDVPNALTLKTTSFGEEQVEDPAGKFTAVRVEVTVAGAEAGSGMTMCIAPGVGLVKSATIGPGGKLSRELKSFTPGK
jgi:hypothetical protein